MRRRFTRRLDETKDPKTMDLVDSCTNENDVAIEVTKNVHCQCSAVMNMLCKSKQVNDRVRGL